MANLPLNPIFLEARALCCSPSGSRNRKYGVSRASTLAARAATHMRLRGTATSESSVERSMPMSLVKSSAPKATPTIRGEATQISYACTMAMAVVHAYDICVASPRIVGVAFGAEDFTNDMGIERSTDDSEVAVPRSLMCVAARAANVLAL